MIGLGIFELLILGAMAVGSLAAVVAGVVFLLVRKSSQQDRTTK